MISDIRKHFEAYPPEMAPVIETKQIKCGYILKIRLTIFSKWDLDFVDSMRAAHCKLYAQPWMSVDIPSAKVEIAMFASETYIKPA